MAGVIYFKRQYFFIGFAKILHRRFQLEAHVHDPAPHKMRKYGKIFGSRRRFQSFSTKKSISTFSAKRWGEREVRAGKSIMGSRHTVSRSWNHWKKFYKFATNDGIHMLSGTLIRAWVNWGQLMWSWYCGIDHADKIIITNRWDFWEKLDKHF